MIKHIVFINVPERSEELKAEVKRRLLALPTHIECIRNLEVGLNFCTQERAYDVALVTEFDSKEDLAMYDAHPAHQEFIAYVKSLPVETKAVDYEF